MVIHLLGYAHCTEIVAMVECSTQRTAVWVEQLVDLISTNRRVMSNLQGAGRE